jgi:DNA-binding response OmpR family regulator
MFIVAYCPHRDVDIPASIAEEDIDIERHTHLDDFLEVMDLYTIRDADAALITIDATAKLPLNSVEAFMQLETDVPLFVAVENYEQNPGILFEAMAAGAYLYNPLKPLRKQVINKHFTQRSNKELIKVGPLEVNTVNRTAKYKGVPLELTPKEYGMLECLAINNGQPISRGKINDYISNYDHTSTSNTTSVYIRRLRLEIDGVQDGDGYKFIQTRRNVGFYLCPENVETNEPRLTTYAPHYDVHLRTRFNGHTLQLGANTPSSEQTEGVCRRQTNFSYALKIP